jgi:hypothetical protein
MAGLAAAGLTVYAAGGTKKTAATCATDDECARGPCHTKQDGNKVCVDCSSSEISSYRGQIQRFCKDEPTGCTSIPATDEVSEAYFTVRLANIERCVDARKNENSKCWDGSDAGHREALDVAERTRKNCHDELSTRRGNGGTYECLDSTYSSRASEANTTCAAVAKGCEDWAKDDKVVNCREIEDAMTRAGKCVEAVERLDSDCLPRLSRNRELQFARGKRAYDTCKEILAHKNSNKLCK